MAVFGEMDESTAGRSLGTRRQAAAEVLGIAPTTFRTHRESRLLTELARVVAIEASEPGETAERRDTPASDRVFVVHAREATDHPLFDLLRAWGLQPQGSWQGWEWGAPTSEAIFDLLQTMDRAAAIIVLLTPTTLTKTGGNVLAGARDNLLLELGLALGAAPQRTVVVSHGNVKLPSGLAGHRILELDNSPTSRNALRSRLEALGLEMETSLAWLDPAIGGDFEVVPVGASLDDDLLETIEEMGFALGRSLGSGGYGSAWMATERQTGKEAVVKLFASPLATRRRWWREALGSAASIAGEGVPKVKAVIETGGGVAAIFEPADGVALGEIGAIPPSESVAIAAGLLETVADLHDKGIVHGDISPSNVLLAEGARPVLVDFGACAPVGDPGRQDDMRAVGIVLLSLLKGQAVRGNEQEIAALGVSEELKEPLRGLLGLHGDSPVPAKELLRALRTAPEAVVR